MNFSFANAPHGLSAVPVSGAFLAEIFVKPVIGTDNSAEVQSREEDSTQLHLPAARVIPPQRATVETIARSENSEHCAHGTAHRITRAFGIKHPSTRSYGNCFKRA